MKTNQINYKTRFSSQFIGRSRGFIATITFALACTSAAVATELYRWVDDTGKVNISDTRPRHIDSQQIQVFRLSAPNIMQKPASTARLAKKTPSKQKKKKRRSSVKKRLDCARYQRKLAAVQERLRSGYREPEGNKLRARRREYRDLLRNCRANQ